MSTAGGFAPLLSVSFVRMYSFSAYRWLIHRYDEVWIKAFDESALDPVRFIGLSPTVGSCSCFFFSGGVVGALVTIAACKSDYPASRLLHLNIEYIDLHSSTFIPVIDNWRLIRSIRAWQA